MHTILAMMYTVQFSCKVTSAHVLLVKTHVNLALALQVCAPSLALQVCAPLQVRMCSLDLTIPIIMMPMLLCGSTSYQSSFVEHDTLATTKVLKF